jgi:hypothetical protein
MVSKAQKEVVYRTIPITSELVPGGTVPPVCVEPTIGKKCEFSKDIELSCAVSIRGMGFDRRNEKT